MKSRTISLLLVNVCVAGAACPCSGNDQALTENASAKAAIWDLEKLKAPPAVKWVDSTSPIRSLTYQGEDYHGAATDVFAFYATPGSVNGDIASDENLPAVVLVHGGGGTAFADWVWLWAKRGYAAIAMDLSGRRPAAPKYRDGQLISNLRVERSRLPRGGPEQGHPEKFASVGGTTEDDWPFHAVSGVIRAHSLIRSFPEVDAERTAVTGISWGGYTTCITASVDHRFKAAVPVYGCGFLYDGESVQRPAIDALPADRRSEWIRRYDPSAHLSKCRVPMLFVNGTSDKHYPLKSYSKSFALVPAVKQMRIEVRMRHSHTAGWEPKEIGLFIDSYLKGTPALPVVKTPRHESGQATADFTSEVPLRSASLHYTTDTGPLLQREWTTEAAQVLENRIFSDGLPKDATIWYLSATDERGAMTSTDVVFAQ